MVMDLHSSPLHSKTNHTIIIDTDCSGSDLRAVSILLSHPGITVKAIMISGGQVGSKEGYERIHDLLHQMQIDSVPVVFWGKNHLKNKLTSADTSLTMVCLGPLTNIAREIENDSEFRSKIGEIVWYIESVDPLKGFNYDYDRKSADLLINSGISIDAISNVSENLILESDFTDLCKQSGTKMSKAFCNSLPGNSPRSSRRKSLALAEELAALFLGNHELFELSPLDANPYIRYNTGYSDSSIKSVLTDMITGRYKSGHFAAFYGFPVDPDLYFYDVRQILQPALSMYGIEEWKACTLTDEFHGHLGVYSIVGAKMGIRARDFFGIGKDLMEIRTYAGSVEPVSCLNDGLQVSTGATLGQGSIHVIPDTIALPQAIFSYNNQSILIRLKDEYLYEIKTTIAKGIKNYGLQDEDYWNLIRQVSIKYWLEWNRNEIFDLIIL
jgi:inosine-uridine nucleoside N-ribohydrolase/formylmethanofuran dehydrogenase subunit E